MEALEHAMAAQMTHDLAITAHQNLARVHAMLFPQGTPDIVAVREEGGRCEPAGGRNRA